jgi:hypothetical protein
MSEPSSILSRVASSLPTMRRQRPQSQAERTRRINYVKKVIRKVYQKNKKDYSSKLAKTKKRDAINLQALTTFLRNPENSGLLNRIYDMSITPTGTLSVEALADRIDPVTIPTIFSPIGVPALERARETPAEIAEARAIEEERQTIPQLERAPETEAELDRVGEGIGIGDQIQRVATQQAQVPQFLQRALGRVNVRGDKTIAERAIKQEKKESKKLVSRAERRMNVPITDSSNIPADPVANQRQEARTNRLPSLPSLPSFPPIPRIPVPTAPIE